MQLEDLRRLKMAIDTGNIKYYHGDMSQAFVDVVDELLNIKIEERESEDYKELFFQAKETATEIATDLEELEELSALMSDSFVKFKETTSYIANNMDMLEELRVLMSESFDKVKPILGKIRSGVEDI